MSRKLPEITPPELKMRADDATVTQTRVYRLITPLFGGGVTPAEADPITVIRGSSIRGHLRFWWRACRGGKPEFQGSLARMKAAEDAIWGAASTDGGAGPSKVQIAVQINNAGVEERPFEVRAGRRGRPEVKLRSDTNVPGYAAFPLQPKKEEARVGMTTKAVRVGVSFTLTISFPRDFREDVEAALWAWETFGGIGARTRRGFGALQLVSVDNEERRPPPAQRAQEVVIRNFRRHVARDFDLPGVPQLLQHLVVTEKVFGDAHAAWHFLIEKLQEFRQERYDSKYGLSKGLSKWPEANSVRQFTNRNPRGKSPRVLKFPRAYFGLPIIFHFPHDRDLQDATLKGISTERLASPLILRPLLCRGDRAVGLAVVLSVERLPPGSLWLDGMDRGLPRKVDADLTPEEAQRIEPLNGETDVLLAFLNTLLGER